MRRLLTGATAVALGVTGTLVMANSGSATSDQEVRYVVAYAEGTSAATARAAVKAAGGEIVSENSAIGVATVTAGEDFAEAANASGALVGAAQDRIVGATAPDAASKARKQEVSKVETEFRSGKGTAPKAPKPKGSAEPLSGLQWDMEQIHAKAANKTERGKGVRVGIMDTGVDGSHPDIAPNFDARLSRNFTTDIPVDANGAPVDGPCEDEPDASCEDAADVDENGHGTHVASTIASPVNGVGITGVAPEADIVNLRVGQDSGYFFLQPSVDALTYAGRNGIDVVNMSYYVDPWLFNCTSHPADSPEDQAEQVTIITAMQRALDYARSRGVTLVAAAGNQAIDYTKPQTDASSPDYASEPGEAAYVRDLLDPESCVSMPTEGDGVIAVSATGPSERKSYYSSYGDGFVDVAAPGGDAYDSADGTRNYASNILAAYPYDLAVAEGAIDPATGEVLVPWAVKDCSSGECSYYQYLQGTSMASPHAAGVAALIVGEYGSRDRSGKKLSPNKVEKILLESATDKACPVPADFTYVRHLPNGTTATSTHTCEGGEAPNGFYGSGIVNAEAAVSR
ncbi:S8 family serine peptidase [Nocardioides sp. KC13]|uniref:S8 family serine peptidase n=1 Tax=Nocardioides turkmenicus TaxID=2711220 RepID=A0A6M1QYN5_9ACTN|nr:S8 family serine peptidase [Nocardioides sp. KC13]NGN92800.1 S8 family serine peptidase [Nocardioides sp. KC13]